MGSASGANWNGTYPRRGTGGGAFWCCWKAVLDAEKAKLFDSTEGPTDYVSDFEITRASLRGWNKLAMRRWCASTASGARRCRNNARGRCNGRRIGSGGDSGDSAVPGDDA